MYFDDLPLAKEAEKLNEALLCSKNLLIEAPTGSGKSLYIPWFLSKHFAGRIVVLQPRRIAALSLAEYSAKLHNEKCGETVGYQFRQEACKSANTKILYQTYGNFLQELLHKKINADWIIFDEYHERKADMDLLFAYFLQNSNLEFPRIAVMSASLNCSDLETKLNIKCLHLGTPLFPVQILNQTNKTKAPLELEVVRALKTLYRNKIWQTTLVFLPGKAEISKCMSAAIDALGANTAEYLELYSGLEKSLQNKIFEPVKTPRIIFTTNIAETSITVPNVSGVIDSGIERVSVYDDNQKINVLRTFSISMQNAIQRAGRAGRTQNGSAIRLWSKDFEVHMQQCIVPEILQIEPSTFILEKLALKCNNLPTPIPITRERTAINMLKNCGMLKNGQITDLGLKAIHTPITGIALMLMLAKAQNAQELPDLLLACIAWISSARETLQKSKEPHNVLELAKNLIDKTMQIPREVSFTYSQLQNYRNSLQKNEQPIKNEEEFVCKKFLDAYPDKLATYFDYAYKLPNKDFIRLQLTEQPFAILALQTLKISSTKSELKVNLFLPIKKHMIASSETVRYELSFKNSGERFVGIKILETETFELSRKEILPQEADSNTLAKLKDLTVNAWREKLQKENWSGKYITPNVQHLLTKMQLAAALYPEYNLPKFDTEDMELIFDEFTSGIFLLRDLNEERYKNIIEDYFGKNMLVWLQKTFPDVYILPNGKRARYSYNVVENFDKGQIVESFCGFLVEISARIEDFMQLRGEHFIASGKLKVRYNILAPNFRTIQKTWNLTGFWQNTYATIRKELRGRYPKHPWPEKIE